MDESKKWLKCNVTVSLVQHAREFYQMVRNYRRSSCPWEGIGHGAIRRKAQGSRHKVKETEFRSQEPGEERDQRSEVRRQTAASQIVINGLNAESTI